jgi:hypothetical protein
VGLTDILQESNGAGSLEATTEADPPSVGELTNGVTRAQDAVPEIAHETATAELTIEIARRNFTSVRRIDALHTILFVPLLVSEG